AHQGRRAAGAAHRGRGLMTDVAIGTAAPVTRAPDLARRRARRHTAKVWMIRLGVLLAMAGAWEVFGHVSGGVFVPPLSATIEHAVILTADGAIWEPLWVSNLALLIGFPISCVLGLSIGTLLGRHRWSDRAFTHYMDLAIVVPMIAL